MKNTDQSTNPPTQATHSVEYVLKATILYYLSMFMVYFPLYFAVDKIVTSPYWFRNFHPYNATLNPDKYFSFNTGDYFYVILLGIVVPTIFAIITWIIVFGIDRKWVSNLTFISLIPYFAALLGLIWFLLAVS